MYCVHHGTQGGGGGQGVWTPVLKELIVLVGASGGAGNHLGPGQGHSCGHRQSGSLSAQPSALTNLLSLGQGQVSPAVPDPCCPTKLPLPDAGLNLALMFTTAPLPTGVCRFLR